ncbi:MAG: rRNA pseudouridine synthase [Chitinispirillaceae bacterium]|nr:rRNA pseudouridine synthase [Chitinispirillaceae bacterium]
MERLDKILANHGFCSRRGADLFLKSHHITLLNGTRLLKTSQKATAREILIDGYPVDHPDGILILLHKPAGCVCSHDSTEGPLVYDLLPSQWMNRTPVPTTIGRLDKDTTGALLITNRMELVHRLTSPTRHISKVYLVTVDKNLSDHLIELFASGTLMLKGEKEPCLPAAMEIIDQRSARLIIDEGKYHQVKRMFGSQGYTVGKLHREKFAEWDVEDLKEGCWKDIEYV